jgi:two-component system, NtrC family, sensor kinase
VPTELPPPPRRPLRRAVLLAFVPLCAVLVAAGTSQFLLARAVHQDVQRLFEELREVALVRALVDELGGVQQWVAAAPAATASSQPLVWADVRTHHTAALEHLDRFQRPRDPSRTDHDHAEAALLTRIRGNLADSSRVLDAPVALRELQAAIDAAHHDAQSLTRAIEDETRTIGAALDQRSDDLAQYLVLLGLVCALTVGGLGWLLQARVLRPVRELRAAAVQLSRGELDAEIPSSGPDELGDLAATFRGMAGRLRQGRQELEQRVEQRSREVLRSARLAQLGTLAAGIAHEVNNPLASIVTCSDGLLRELDRGNAAPEALREYLQILRKEALRARDITVRLLHFARHDEPRREAVDLLHEAHEVGAMFAHQLQDRQVTLRCEASADPAPTFVGDPAEWRQVLFNLVRNALDASPAGACITITVQPHGDGVRLQVRDQGPGIPTADLDRIFEPFYTTKDPGHGTGLGLPIVLRIVESHRGRIRVDNAEPGAVFTVDVPRR